MKDYQSVGYMGQKTIWRGFVPGLHGVFRVRIENGCLQAERAHLDYNTDCVVWDTVDYEHSAKIIAYAASVRMSLA